MSWQTLGTIWLLIGSASLIGFILLAVFFPRINSLKELAQKGIPIALAGASLWFARRWIVRLLIPGFLMLVVGYVGTFGISKIASRQWDVWTTWADFSVSDQERDNDQHKADLAALVKATEREAFLICKLRDNAEEQDKRRCVAEYVWPCKSGNNVEGTFACVIKKRKELDAEEARRKAEQETLQKKAAQEREEREASVRAAEEAAKAAEVERAKAAELRKAEEAKAEQARALRDAAIEERRKKEEAEAAKADEATRLENEKADPNYRNVRVWDAPQSGRYIERTLQVSVYVVGQYRVVAKDHDAAGNSNGWSVCSFDVSGNLNDCVGSAGNHYKLKPSSIQQFVNMAGERTEAPAPQPITGPLWTVRTFETGATDPTHNITRTVMTDSRGNYRLVAKEHDAAGTVYTTSTCVFDGSGVTNDCVNHRGEHYKLKPSSIPWLVNAANCMVRCDDGAAQAQRDGEFNLSNIFK